MPGGSNLTTSIRTVRPFVAERFSSTVSQPHEIGVKTFLETSSGHAAAENVGTKAGAVEGAVLEDRAMSVDVVSGDGPATQADKSAKQARAVPPKRNREVMGVLGPNASPRLRPQRHRPALAECQL